MDRFWDAVHLDSPESPCNDNIIDFSNINGYDEPCTPEIFAKVGSNPTVDVRAPWNSPTTPSFPCQPSAFLAPTILVQSPPSPVDLLVEQSKRRFWSRSPAKQSTRWPKLAIPQDLKPRTPGVNSPATAILASVSNFLDDIVKLTRSQSPNANATVVGSPDGDIEIVDSEVSVNVLNEAKRASICSTMELRDERPLEKPDIPPITALPLLDASPMMSTRELDALCRLNWESQLGSLDGLVRS